MREDKTERLVGGRRGGGDVPVTQTVKVATLEKRCGSAENKIDMPGDVAVFKVLAATIEQDRVLPSQKAAISKRNAITVDAQRQRLPDRPGGILEGDVLRRKSIAVDLRRR